MCFVDSCGLPYTYDTSVKSFVSPRALEGPQVFIILWYISAVFPGASSSETYAPIWIWHIVG